MPTWRQGTGEGEYSTTGAKNIRKQLVPVFSVTLILTYLWVFMSGHESVKNEGFCRSIQLLTLFYNLQKSFIFLLLLFVTS